jgi:dCMP deaminase
MNFSEKIKVFMNIANELSSLSKDPSTKVGALILRPDLTIVSMGYNGFAKGIEDSEEIWNDRGRKYKYVIHAETNAILTSNECLKDYILLCTHFPCPNCMSNIIQKGISQVYYKNEPREDHSSNETFNMIFEAGLEVMQVN